MRIARRLVNSGRLSVPAVFTNSELNTPDVDADFATGPGAMMPGAPAADAPVAGPDGPWLLAHLCNGFTLLTFGLPASPRAIEALASATIPCRVLQVTPAGPPGPGRLTHLRRTAFQLQRNVVRPGATLKLSTSWYNRLHMVPFVVLVLRRLGILAAVIALAYFSFRWSQRILAIEI
jgi:hypothetical protein